MNNILYIDFNICDAGYMYLHSYLKTYCSSMIDSFDYVSYDTGFIFEMRSIFEDDEDGSIVNYRTLSSTLSVLKNDDLDSFKDDMDNMNNENMYHKADKLFSISDDCINSIKDMLSNYNIFLFRFYEFSEPHLVRLINVIRETVPNAFIILGDKTNLINPHLTDKLPVDSIVYGFGEEPLEDIIHKISFKESIPDSYHGKPPLKNYIVEHEGICSDDCFSIRTSYACLYNCSFCVNYKHGVTNKNRIECIKSVVNNIKRVSDRYGISHVKMCDSLFYTKEDQLKVFIEELRDNKLEHITFDDVNVRTNETLKNIDLYRRINASYRVGMEHLDDDILKEMRKGCTGKQNIELIKLSSKYGMKIYGNFIYGWPTESVDVFDKYIRNLEIFDSVGDFITNMNRFRLRMGSEMENKPEKFGIQYYYDYETPRYFGLNADKIPCGYHDDTLKYKDDRVINSSIRTATINFPPISVDSIRNDFNIKIKFYKG